MATDGTSNYSILKVKTFAVGKVTAVGSDYVNVTYKKGDSDIITKTKLGRRRLGLVRRHQEGRLRCSFLLLATTVPAMAWLRRPKLLPAR